MREVSFERELLAEPTRTLPRLERALVGRGYQPVARSTNELSFLGAGPSGPHRLAVRADGHTVRFTFAPGGLGVTLPPEATLERALDEALAALGEASSPAPRRTEAGPAPARCSICATPLTPGVRICPTCGMQN